MRVESVQVENYKSFLDSEELYFGPGFNVIIGQNNVGKTSFIEALSTRFVNKPHRSLEVAPFGESQVKLSLELDEGELFDILSTHLATFNLPIGGGRSPEVQIERFLEVIRKEHTVKCTFKGGQLYSAFLPSYSEEFAGLANGTDVSAIQFGIFPGEAIPHRVSGSMYTMPYGNTLPMQLANLLKERIYAFNAERFHIGESGMGTGVTLEPSARNLPEVLHNLLSSNPIGFNRFVKTVSTVFPEIKAITAPPISQSSARILIWSIDPISERNDLAISLLESGTGVGQVLAMIYVVLTSEFARTIVIDEPQSFLHPGAVRKLFDILKQYPQHQYIITTHSPTALAAADAQCVFLLRKIEAKSAVEKIDFSETREVGLILSEVGARLSDVFGADNILWVEGRTEEQCFPLILSKIANQLLYGTTVLSVLQVGDFESDDAERIIRIYNRLTMSKGLLPPAVGFIFDRESRNSRKIKELEKISKGKVFLTRRRMYENYLLNFRAITSIVSRIDSLSDQAISLEKVTGWVQNHRWDEKYFVSKTKKEDKTDQFWFKEVHAANFLKDLFNYISENRVRYDKIEHGIALTSWILQNEPSKLTEVAELIKTALEKEVGN